MRVDKLLEEDAACGRNSLLLLREFPPAVEAFELAASLYENTADAFGSSSYERTHAHTFEQVAEELGLTVRQLQSRVEAEDPASVATVAARAADRALVSRMAQKYAFQLAWRAFRWGATDLRRLRVTAAHGYLRVQAEAIGLMALFRDEPESGRQWLSPTEDHKKLFWEMQPRVKAQLDQFDLRFAYEHGSSGALHASFAAGVSGSRFGTTESQVVIELADQEFNAADPFMFHNASAFFLRIQERCLGAIPVICSDLQGDTLTIRLDEFRRQVDDVYWLLSRRYAARIAAVQQVAGVPWVR